MIFRRSIVFLIISAMLFCLTSCNLGGENEGGKDGLSAYDLAVQNGFEGTLEEWLDSLKGPYLHLLHI